MKKQDISRVFGIEALHCNYAVCDESEHCYTKALHCNTEIEIELDIETEIDKEIKQRKKS